MSGTIGFSDELRPGDVAKLASTNQIAFRARIVKGKMPDTKDLYWRGDILSSTDGKNWLRPERAQDLMDVDRSLAAKESNLVVQEITLEPHQRKWVFAMDRADSVEVLGGFSTKFAKFEGNVFRSERKIQGRMSYRASSRIGASSNPSKTLSGAERKRELQLPRGYDSPLKELASELRVVASDDWDYVQRVLQYFGENNFEYSLTPGVLQKRDISEFVFESKKGFCEHFASATALLLRLGGIPSRVIIGFHGGKVNPYGNYLIVGYRDAHSWVEAWIAGKGWVRVDPTAVVAPGRISLGGQEFVDRFGVDAETIRDLATNLKDDVWTAKRIITEIIFFWDSINDSWNNTLISYDRDYQREMLSNMSVKYPIWLQLMLLGSVGILFMGVLLFVYYRLTRQPTDQVVAIYFEILSKLERKGIHRNYGEGPLDFLTRIKSHRKDSVSLPKIESAIEDYVDLRFGRKENSPENIREFRRKARILA